MPLTRVILVGGFLGAGKTTLIAQAAERLKLQGRRVGLLANDQAADMVDTAVLKETGSEVDEVAGGCFCCRFPDMIARMQRLVRQQGVDVVMGEPVGSCTDLSATVLQPLKRLHADDFSLAPFSVLVDGNQVRVLCRLHKAGQADPASRFPDDVLYIYQKQLEEADLIVLNKADRLAPAELAELTGFLAAQFPETPILTMSALSGEGVDAWLEAIGRQPAAGHKIAEVDYDTYAAGEAALGWMNASGRLRARGPVDWKQFAGTLLESIRRELDARGAEIAHLKLFLTAKGGYLAGNLTSSAGEVSLRGQLSDAVAEVSLLVNARVLDLPDRLQATVEKCLTQVAGEAIETTLTNRRSFFPGRPDPTHRDRTIA
jgi:G3E family GTPase